MFPSFIQSLAGIVSNMTNILRNLMSKRVSLKFREQIILTVTAVNKCRYCTMLHTRIGQKSGLSREDIKQIFALNFKDIKEEEIPALIFAQHYAQNSQNPSKEALKDLISFYGTERARDILTFIQMITLGNLMGNTIESFESRVKGHGSDGSYFFEFLVYVIGFFFHKTISQLRNRN